MRRLTRPLFAPRMPHGDYLHTVDRWDDATGEYLMEQIAALGVASETYRAAVKRWPRTRSRCGARVLEKSWD